MSIIKLIELLRVIFLLSMLLFSILIVVWNIGMSYLVHWLFMILCYIKCKMKIMTKIESLSEFRMIYFILHSFSLAVQNYAIHFSYSKKIMHFHALKLWNSAIHFHNLWFNCVLKFYFFTYCYFIIFAKMLKLSLLNIICNENS